MLKFVFYVSCVVEASEATGVACQCTAQDPLDAATISALSALSGNGTEVGDGSAPYMTCTDRFERVCP